MSAYIPTVNVKNIGAVVRILQTVGRDRAIYTDIILSSWQVAAKKMFETGGFGRWAPLKTSTQRYRQNRSRGHYKRRRPGIGTTASGPPNTWSGTLRQSIMGTRQRNIQARKIRVGNRIQITTRLAYAADALTLRPIDDPILGEATEIMADIMQFEFAAAITRAIVKANL